MLRLHSLMCIGNCLFVLVCYMILFFFFFQAEDGIRDVAVTGVQTCALPIYFQRAPGEIFTTRDFCGTFAGGALRSSDATVAGLAASSNDAASLSETWSGMEIGRASCRERV